MRVKSQSRRRPSNPQGRVDVLLSRIADRVIETHPQVTMFHRAVYYSFKEDLHRLLTSRIGPRTKAGRTVKKLIAGSKQAGIL